VPICTLKIIEGISGLQSEVREDPYYETIKGFPTNILAPHQKQAIQQVIEIQSPFWKFENLSRV
jgi:hypothetical protein